MSPMVPQTHLNLMKTTPTIRSVGFFPYLLLNFFVGCARHKAVATLHTSIHSVLPVASENSKLRSSGRRGKGSLGWDFLRWPL